MQQHALARFHRPPEPLNCAQALLYAYQQVTGDSSLSVPDFKAFGGGRAPDGICGALYSACVVLPAHAETLKTEFAAITGSVLCKEIKGKAKTPCEMCVAEAARLLQTKLSASQR